ncbi:MAG TPA: hypothetical protein VIE17_09955 [Methylophilaceae bacterium]
MKYFVLMLMLSLMWIGSARAEGESSLIVYMSPEKYNHPVLVGVAPLYTRWVYQAEIAEGAASKALATKFSEVSTCEAGKRADVIAWVKPRLVYNPAVGTYYAKLKVELHLGDGRTLATYKAEGQHDGRIDSLFMVDEVSLAFDDAMRQIMLKVQADTGLQNNIQSAKAAGFTRSPCSMVAVLSTPKSSDWFW